MFDIFWRNQAIVNTFNPAPRAAQTGKTSDEPRVNSQITAPQVRLIDENNANVGIVVIREALRRAQNAGLDLVEISTTGNMPVCKIIDAGKYKYELQKRKSEAKKKQKVQLTKEIKMSVNIDKHDIEIKAKKAIEFIGDQNKVKVSVVFQGREMAYMNLGKEILDQFVEAVGDVAVIDKEAKQEGRSMMMILAPKK